MRVILRLSSNRSCLDGRQVIQNMLRMYIPPLFSRQEEMTLLNRLEDNSIVGVLPGLGNTKGPNNLVSHDNQQNH